MYNLRYHIASLTAVFVALAIGLVLGGLVVRQGGFDTQQRALVSSLQNEYNKIKKQNSELTSSLSLEERYGAQMTDSWATGRLAGRTVVVLTSGDAKEGADAAAAAIKSAGGGAAIVTLIKPGFGLKDSAVATAVASALGTTRAVPSSADVAGVLTSEWDGAASARPLTDALVAAGAIKVAGLTHSTVATLAVDLATAGGDPDGAGLDVLSAYAAGGMYALGAETSASGSGVAAAAAARKLSAFDTLGTNVGRYTLIALFSGGEQGYYSDTARGASPFPPVPKP